MGSVYIKHIKHFRITHQGKIQFADDTGSGVLIIYYGSNIIRMDFISEKYRASIHVRMIKIFIKNP